MTGLILWTIVLVAVICGCVALGGGKDIAHPFTALAFGFIVVLAVLAAVSDSI